MNMEKKIIAKDLLNKFIEWELNYGKYPKYKNNYKKSTQSHGKYSNWKKAKDDGMGMKDVLIRNLYMWSNYVYGGMTYKEVADKFDLSYGWTIGIIGEIDYKINYFLKKV